MGKGRGGKERKRLGSIGLASPGQAPSLQRRQQTHGKGWGKKAVRGRRQEKRAVRRRSWGGTNVCYLPCRKLKGNKNSAFVSQGLSATFLSSLR